MEHWPQRTAALPLLVTTSYMCDEPVRFFDSWGDRLKAVQVGRNFLHSSSAQFVLVNEALFYEGWRYFQRQRDKNYPLTDCVSFVVMQTLGISTAFAFDQHFV